MDLEKLIEKGHVDAVCPACGDHKHVTLANSRLVTSLDADCILGVIFYFRCGVERCNTKWKTEIEEED